MSFEVKELENWQKNLLKKVEEFPNEKRKELKKLAVITQGQIKPLVNVDTGRLRNSITHKVVDNDTAIVGTNVEYAAAVNNGYMQDKRFLPAKYLNTPNGRKYLGNNGKGIMLKAKYIKGVHFMEKGIQNAQPIVEAELDRWFNELLKELG